MDFGSNPQANNFSGENPFEVSHFTIYNDRAWIKAIEKRYEGKFKARQEKNNLQQRDRRLMK